MIRAVLSLLVLLVTAGPAAGQELTLSVATSLKEAVEEIGRRFVESRPGVTLHFTLGASGELQKQIEAGAPVDVFVTASPREMDELEQAGLIVAATRRVLASNVLVAIRPGDSRLDVPGPSDLLDRRVQRIGIGNPRTVPAGRYAEESLRALGLWERVRPRLIFAENVRQVLDAVVRGELDVGFVYATDAVQRLGEVRLAFAFSDDTHRPILHLAAVVKGARAPDSARAFVEFLVSPTGKAVLGRLGFEPAPAGGR